MKNLYLSFAVLLLSILRSLILVLCHPLWPRDCRTLDGPPFPLPWQAVTVSNISSWLQNQDFQLQHCMSSIFYGKCSAHLYSSLSCHTKASLLAKCQDCYILFLTGLPGYSFFSFWLSLHTGISLNFLKQHICLISLGSVLTLSSGHEMLCHLPLCTDWHYGPGRAETFSVPENPLLPCVSQPSLLSDWA